MINDVKDLIENTVGNDSIINVTNNECENCIEIRHEKIKAICLLLRDQESTYFDMLSCITGIDNFPKEETIEVIYNLYSIPYERKLSLKVKLDRGGIDNNLPSVDSVVEIWATANWQEREVYDLLGVQFTNHPNLRRILLPTDWEGFPLRKDYQLQEYYHGIKVEY